MAATRDDLTPQQFKALKAFHRLTKKDSQPSIKEWAKAMGRCYTTADRHKDSLIRLGLMTTVKGKNRSTKLTPAGEALAAGGK